VRILIVEDLPADVEIAVRTLKKAGLDFDYLHVEDREEFLAALAEFRPEVVISDYSIPGFDGMEALELSLTADPLLPFVVLTGSMNESTAVACMKAGASDYVLKSHISRLPFAVTEALEKAAARKENARTLEELRESEQNLRTLADSGHALIRTGNPDGSCTWFNRVWLEFTGRTPEEEQGHGWMEGIHQDDVERCRGALSAVVTHRESYRTEYRLRNKDGSYRWILDIGSPRFTSEGSFAGYIGHCLDITEQKETEASIRDALRDRETLLSELYHRTRNSMQVIVAMLEIRASAHKDPAVRAAMQEVTERIISMSLVHKNLYETQNLSEIEMPVLVEDIRHMVVREHSCDRRGIVVTSELEPVTVSIDTAVPCALVLYELLSNAVTHAYPHGEGGEVRVRVTVDPEEHVVMEVSDDGCGVPEEFDLWHGERVGLQFVSMIVDHQLQGKVNRLNGTGLTYRIEFPKIEKARRI
jgi:PAS domain S-box-containing protein